MSATISHYVCFVKEAPSKGGEYAWKLMAGRQLVGAGETRNLIHLRKSTAMLAGPKKVYYQIAADAAKWFKSQFKYWKLQADAWEVRFE